MNYHGVTADPVPGFPDFLLAALRNAPAETPYRGPESYTDGEFENFEYACSWSGGFGNFAGQERIVYKGKEIYTLKFHGGRVDYA